MPPFCAALVHVDAVEPLGQARQVFGRDARAVIAHAEQTRLAASVRVLGLDASAHPTLPPPSPYLTAFSIRFSSSAQKLVAGRRARCTGSSGSSACDRRRRAPSPAASACRPSARAMAARSTRVRRGNVEPHLDARQRQEIVDQPRHALRLLAHDVEKALPRRRRRCAPGPAGSR